MKMSRLRPFDISFGGVFSPQYVISLIKGTQGVPTPHCRDTLITNTWWFVKSIIRFFEVLRGCLYNIMIHHVPVNDNHPKAPHRQPTSATIIKGGEEEKKQKTTARGPLASRKSTIFDTWENPGKCGSTACCKPAFVFVSYCHSLSAATAVKLNTCVLSWEKGRQTYHYIYYQHLFYLPIFPGTHTHNSRSSQSYGPRGTWKTTTKHQRSKLHCTKVFSWELHVS